MDTQLSNKTKGTVMSAEVTEAIDKSAQKKKRNAAGAYIALNNELDSIKAT
jgi:hypothetical protein